MSAVTRSVIVRLRAEMAQFKREWDQGTGAVKGTREELGRASKQARETAKATDQTGTSVGKLSANLRNHRTEWDLVGSSLLKTGVGLAAMSGLMTKAAIDWESAWAGVTKTVEGTPAQLDAVEAGLRGLVKTMPQSHDQIAAVAEAAGQLGVATDDVVAFTRVMVMLGDTTNLSAEEAATSIAQLMNVMQTAPEDVDRVGAALVALGNDGASTERDIVQMAQRIAGAGEIIGLSEANVLSLANALASSGIEVEAGGSAISNVLIDISKSVSDGGSDLEEFAKVAGTTATDFAAKWESDPASALADFTEGLGRMSANGEDVFGTLERLGQSDVRVTRALLNMANAGDLLRNSLATGDAAWQRNTALVEEAEKRYDTTAAKAKIAWNNIKDNAIDAGQGMLPVVSAISDIVVQLADAFGSLPGPVKSALGVLAGGTGVALLTAGAFLKVLGTAYDLRAAFVKLDASGSAGARGLGKVARAASILTAALIAAQALDAFDKLDVAGVNEFTRGLLEAADGSDKLINKLSTTDASGPFGWYQNAVDGVADAFDKAAEAKGKMDLSFAHDSGWERGKKLVEQYDQALTSLVQSGAVEEAGRVFDYLTETTGRSQKELKSLLPGYADALQGLDVEQRLAAESTKDLAGGSKALEMTLAELGGGEEAKKMLQDLTESSADAASAFFDFAGSSDAARDSVKSWLKDLEAQHRAMEDWADNMIKAASRGVDEGVLKEFEKMGPEGAKLLAELVDGSQSEIDRLNKIWGDAGTEAQSYSEILNALPRDVITEFKVAGAEGAVETAANVASKYGLLPDQVTSILEALDYTKEDIARVLRRLGVVDNTSANPSINVNPGNSFQIINGIQRSINSITGRTVYVKVAQSGGTPGGITENADGGAIEGPGGPREDNLLSWVSSGEHVWTAAEVAALGGQSAMYAMRAAVRAGRRPTFADGGAGSDAWNESYRSAAAAYGAPVRSQQASPPVVVTGGGNGIDDRVIDVLASRLQAGVTDGVMAGMHGAAFQPMPDGTIRLILKRGR